MFCLRSWLPLLFIPTNASPIFILLFFLCTYFLNRPCVYCSFLLLILFASSCHWSEHCFFDFSNTSNFFLSPSYSSTLYPSSILSSASDLSPNVDNVTLSDSLNATIPAIEEALLIANTLNSTAKELATFTIEEARRRRPEWTGIGVGWLRSLLGRREWRLPCVDVYVRL